MTMVSRRLASVDAFRALTMLLMIFVNDLPSLTNIPSWLEHAGEMEDRMGLADVVFPAFLFIVGLSIPFAIATREAKGYSRKSTFLHILNRSLALLVMGIYDVNYENYSGDALIPKYWWLLLVTIAFFLVWLDYPREMGRRRTRLLQGSGILILVVMALVYKGGDPGHTTWMRVHWYGILGLIGWCYLLCASLYLWTRGRSSVLWVIFFFFIGLCCADKMGLLHVLKPIRNYFWIVGSGSLPALTMGGVLAAMIYRIGTDNGKANRSLLYLLVFAVLATVAGFALRPYWGGISKIRATPAWILICMGISLLSFALLAYIMDIKGRKDWYKLLKPAGTSTLTCYLLPYIHFAIYHLLGESWRLPLDLRTGIIGILKSMVYAFLIVLLTGWLEKKKVRLSI